MVESKLENSAPLGPGARMQAERFFRDGLLLLGPVETMRALDPATIAGQERKRPSAHRKEAD